jgi:hypothetical protein
MPETERGRREISSASAYVEKLVNEGLAILVPSRLQGKRVGWNFKVETDEFSGYEVAGVLTIDLGKVITTPRGHYTIIGEGVADKIGFEGKTGASREWKFVVIRNNISSKRMAFIAGRV